MIDPDEVQVSLSLDDDPVRNASEIQDEAGRPETHGCVKRLRSSWQPVLIAILMVVIFAVIGVLFSGKNEKQSLEAKLQHMEGEIFAAKINTDELQKENNQLKQLLNITNQNFTTMLNNGQLELVLNVVLLLAEKTQLSQLLEGTLQEKTQLQVDNNELNMLLNSTLQSCNLVEEENIQLKAALNQSLHNLTMTSAENDMLQLLLAGQQQTTLQLETKNQLQHSILFSNRMSFVWTLCNNDTLQCSRCLPGWTEHASRCFFLSTVALKWENARWDCVNMGADLAVVLNAEDQAFLTNLTFQYTQQYPDEDFHSAWIGLQDMVKEGTHYWINGNRIQSDVIYWRPMEPNNAIASWDVDQAGQDCVAIVPPNEIGTSDWLNSWDDIVCLGARHYICETQALILS